MSMLTKSCSFCNRPIAKGSGTMLAKNDGTVLWSCSSKCKKNLLVLKRDPRKLKWTKNTLKAELKSKSKLAEQTLIIVKPDAVKRNLAEEILSRFKKKGFSISKLKTFNFTVEMAEQFYSVHRSKPFFGELVSFITSGTVVAAIIEGDNVINVTREIIGKTNPKEASPGTIRGDFGTGILENSIHASDSRESFDKEVNVVF